MSEQQHEPGDGLANLTRPEHLLVWAMRAIALGREDCPVLLKMFRRSCGRSGEEVLQAYSIFVKYVAMTSRRRLQVHTPGCPCVGDDERAVVAVLAAAQRALEGQDAPLLQARLAALTGRDDASLFEVAHSIGRLLRASGLMLPRRFAATAPEGLRTDAPQAGLLH